MAVCDVVATQADNYTAYVTLSLNTTTLLTDELTFVSYDFASNDPARVLPLPELVNDFYLLDITPLIADKVWTYNIKVEISFANFARDPEGNRAIDLAAVRYDRSKPQEQWTSYFGDFSAWLGSIAQGQLGANPKDTTYVPFSRGIINTKDQTVFPLLDKSKIYLYVAARQSSSASLSLLSGEIQLIITRGLTRQR